MTLCLLAGALLWSPVAAQAGSDPVTAEATLRLLVKANADKDIATLSKYMAHDADVVGYTIGGRKYVGWPAFEHEMKEEFDAVTKLEIPITELKMWQKGDVAWFSMELDYIRYVGVGAQQTRMALPLRETGVLEKRQGRWVLHTWHESSQTGPVLKAVNTGGTSAQKVAAAETPDLSGEWQIEEEDKAYKATLDKAGNGTYTHKGGMLKTTGYANRLWQGTWEQPENDREGGFEVLLSEDGKSAKGIWWYSRVGGHKNIPPKEHGGTYSWTRLTPLPAH